MNFGRNAQLDSMKGIGIFLVIVGHISTNKFLNIWIYSFHMPLFFFISGIIYYMSKVYTSKEFLLKKCKSLLMPYFMFSALSFIYWYFIERYIRGSDKSAIHQFIEIFVSQGGDGNHEFNVVLWFLPCLFVTEILFDFIRRKFKDRKLIVFFLAICSITGFIFSKYASIRLPFSIDTMFVIMPFYGLGFLIAPVFKKINSLITDNKIIISIICILSSMGVVFFYKGNNFNNNNYSNYILLYIVAVIGIISIITFSNIINKNKPLLYLGSNTLVLMCIHEPLKRIILIIVSKITNINMDILRSNILLILLVSILLILIMYPFVIIINKYMPFMLGKFKSKKNLKVIMD